MTFAQKGKISISISAHSGIWVEPGKKMKNYPLVTCTQAKVVDCTLAGIEIGSVVIVITTERDNQIFRENILRSIWIALAMCVTFGFLGYMASKYLLSPLQELSMYIVAG